MRANKLIALTMVALFALIIAVPLASNAATPNPWTPTTIILPQQDNTQPKAIPTDPLGYYVKDADSLTYDTLSLEMQCFPEPNPSGGSDNITFWFDYHPDLSRGDWFIVDIEGVAFFAIDNITRDIGLNGTELFHVYPANESVITRHTGVYSFLALPTGIKAGDSIRVMTMIGLEEIIEVTLEVSGRITTPILGVWPPTEYYDTWRLHGTFEGPFGGYPVSLACEQVVDTETGIFIGSTTGLSSVNDKLKGFGFIMQFNSTQSTGGILVPLPTTGIDSHKTPESSEVLRYKTFTYNESGYWYMDFTIPSGGALGIVRLNSTDGSYVNFTLGEISGDDIPVDTGIFQNVSIPDDLWNYYGPWSNEYYDETTRTGHYGKLWASVFNITDFTRLVDFFGGNINCMFMAPPWIRDGSVFFNIAFLPLFWPNSTEPNITLPGEYPEITCLTAPFRVSGAVTLSINGSDYDCWKAEMLVPSGLSDVNFTQVHYEAYFERTSGILMRAEADIEATVPVAFGSDVYWVAVGYHKNWTVSDLDGDGVLPPGEWNDYFVIYYNLTVPADQEWTLDPSKYNGGSVTVECSEYVNVEMYTATQSEGDWYLKTIAGDPVVKLLYVEHNASISADFNATVNFYYTPYELQAMGARESGFRVYAWNGTAWELLNTVWDSEGRVVSANTTHLSVFALVAAPELSMWGLLGPTFLLLLQNTISQTVSPLGGLMLPLIGIGVVFVAAIALAAFFLKRKP